MAHASSDNLYGLPTYIVDVNPGKGSHITIQSAINDAVSGDVIGIRSSSSPYTENITLKAGVNLISYIANSLAGEANSPNVIIEGKCSANFSGSCSLSGICLQTNADYCLAVTGSSSTQVILDGCTIKLNDNTGIQLSSSSSSSRIELRYCKSDTDTTGISLFDHSGAGVLKFFHCNLENRSASTTVSTISGTGSVDFYNSFCAFRITTSSTSQFSAVNTEFQRILTMGSTGSQVIRNCKIESSTSAVSVSSGCTVELNNCSVKTSGASSITGAGTVKFGGLVFCETSLIDTTTQTPLVQSNDAVKVKSPGAYPYTAVPQDEVILVDSSSARTINLNASPATGQCYRIKDATGNAATNTITVSPASGNIDGSSSYLIITNYGSIDVVYSGSEWLVL